MDMYRLVVLDLDGTLTNNRKEITSRTREALLRYQEEGGRIVLASGRPTYGVWPLARELKLDEYGSYILSFNGAVITECRQGEVLFRRELPPDVPALLASMAREYGTSLLTYQDDCICTETPWDLYVQKEVICTKMKVRELKNFAEEITFPVVKCMLMERGGYLAGVEERLKERIGSRLSIYRSEPYFLEVMPEGIDKARSLTRLLEMTGMGAEDMMAFGDGYNDKSMIMMAGFGVAMRNGQPSEKAVADYVAPSNEEDGVAYVIENMLDGEKLG